MIPATQQVADAPTGSFEGILCRVVPVAAMFPPGKPADPDFLFTSGKPNRFNLPGTACTYWSADEVTALAEFRRQFRGLPHAMRQPVTLYCAEVHLRKVLDLTEVTTCGRLRLQRGDLTADWGGGLPPNPTQLLGEAVREQGIVAIRYSSVAAQKTSPHGNNLVIFRENLKRPDFLRVLGPDRRPIQQWP